MTTINEKEKHMLRSILAHPMADMLISGFEKEAESLAVKLNKKKIDKKAKIESFTLKHFVFEMAVGNGSIIVTSTIPPNPKRNYSCEVCYTEKKEYLRFMHYLLNMNAFYGNRLSAYATANGDSFNVCEADWVERTYDINSNSLRFDSTSIYEEVGTWTRIRPSRLEEIVAMLVPRLFEEYPDELKTFGVELQSLYDKWQTMEKGMWNKVFHEPSATTK